MATGAVVSGALAAAFMWSGITIDAEALRPALDEFCGNNEDLPWRVFKPVQESLDTQPTVLLAEASFAAIALGTFVHACIHGRQHLLVWFAAVISGTANDIIFMMLPFVDNFFHAQMTIMLTPRLPLYIPLAYIAFQYCGCVAAWRLELPVIANAAASALASAIFYSAYDITGAKFLWWSWHDTDPPISERWLGVPMGSTMWTLVHVFVFSLLLHVVALKNDKLSIFHFLVTIIVSATITTPAMMITMGPFQLHQLRLAFDLETMEMPTITRLPGKPDAISLGLVIVTFTLLALNGLSHRPPHGNGKTANIGKQPYTWLVRSATADRILLAGIIWHFCLMILIMTYADPSTVVATGIHQTYGECAVAEEDLLGYPREKYLCKEQYDEDFTFDCDAAQQQIMPPKLSDWYTICGKSHTDYERFVGAIVTIASIGITSFAAMLF